MNPLDEGEPLLRLRQSVEKQIDEYVYFLPAWAMGNPIPPERIAAGLAEMRASLVEPYWVDVEIRDTFERCGMSSGPRRRCVVVADDRKGMWVLFDPVEDSLCIGSPHGHGPDHLQRPRRRRRLFPCAVERVVLLYRNGTCGTAFPPSGVPARPHTSYALRSSVGAPAQPRSGGRMQPTP